MANQKISELNSIGVGGLDDSDLFVLVDSSATETKHIPWNSIKIPPFIGARVGFLTNTTADYTAGVQIAWNNEVTDTHDFYSATSATLFLIPPAFGGMYFDVSVAWASDNVINGQEIRGLIEHYNAADTKIGQAGFVVDASSGNGQGFHTPNYNDVLVDSGDYFSFWFDTLNDTAIDASTRSYFSLRLVGQ